MPTDAPGSVRRGTGQPTHSVVRRVSLGSRIILVTVASALITVLVAGIVGYPLARDAADQEARVNLGKLADATAAAVVERPGSTDGLIPPGLYSVLDAEDVAVYLVGPRQGMPGFITGAEGAAIRDGEPVDGRADLPSGRVIYSARLSGNATAVLLTQPDDAMRGMIGLAVNRLVLALGAGVAIAALIGVVLALRLTAPLRIAAAAAERLSKGDRDVALSVDGPREIAEVSHGLAELQRALAQSEGRLREFLMSVSHELRTPLTAILGYAEALADGVVTSESEIRRAGRVMVEESERLDRLVADLLDLARMDADEFVIEARAVDFSVVVRQAAEVWGDRCRDEGLIFDADIPTAAIDGSSDATRVRQVLDNLLANALRVTPSGQVIVVSVQADRESVILQVRDGGPGLTADDCAVAFDPGELYSRYRGIRRVGTGVGLALVGRLAERLGGRAEAGAAPEGGAAFTVIVARRLGAQRRSLDA